MIMMLNYAIFQYPQTYIRNVLRSYYMGYDYIRGTPNRPIRRNRVTTQPPEHL